MLRTPPGWLVATLIVFAGGTAPAARAQDRSTDLGPQASFARYGEFDESAFGVGLRLGHRFGSRMALDAELNFEPGGLGDPTFSANRFEALAGFRVGLDLRRSGVYLAVRGGVSDFAAAPEPFACLAIYPPPLACALAAGKTLPALHLGAGYQAFVGASALLRFEVGDRLLRYPGPAIGKDRERHDADFWSHDLRVTAGVGWRF